MRVRVMLASVWLTTIVQAAPGTGENMFGNASFENGRAGWRVDTGGKTVAKFSVDSADAAEGGRSALVTIDRVDDWGTQFGQTFSAGRKGKTYTFAVCAKSVGGPVAVDLQIERPAKPWDRAAKGKRVTLTDDKWTELHVTFTVRADFPQGWFAYVSCTQAKARYRADAFRLYEGPYVPYRQAARKRSTSVAARVFDTGAMARAVLSGEAVAARRGWTRVADSDLAHKFKGDAVLMNNRLAVVLRRGAAGGEVYSLDPPGAKLRATLVPTGGGAGVSIWSARFVGNTDDGPGNVIVDAMFTAKGGKRLTVRHELTMGQVFATTRALGETTGLRVVAPCRFAVLPDFFADDMVIDATRLPVATAELPSENFLLQLIDGGEAMVTSVWNVRSDDVRIALAGKDAARRITGSEIQYGPKGKICVAVMAAKGTWHAQQVGRTDAGRVMPLKWVAPYGAQWRVDYFRRDGFIDSWEMAVEKPSGGYVRPGWFGSPRSLPANRKKWTTVLGRFLYPCWMDKRGRGYLQPLAKQLRFEGPAVIYPLNRCTHVRKTPMDVFTVVDIMRATLGVGPCEYILDVEGQAESYKGRATCATRTLLNKIYAQPAGKRDRAQIDKALVDVMAFIRHIRGRIEKYVAFGHEMLEYLAERKKAEPELAERLAELVALTRSIDARLAKRRVKIKTPDDAAKLVEQFKKGLLGYEGSDALKRCKYFTEAWVEIGGNQDELVGECRMAVKVLRQRAGLLMALDGRMKPVCDEVRRRTRKMLRNPTSYEAARH